jgi:Fe2+ transport system protein FeoA
MTLLDIPAGAWGKIGEPSAVEGAAQAPSATQSRTIAQLQSYGLSSGTWVTMLQSNPVIILRVDHLELAMEKEIARQIIVTEISPRQGE